ncbi:hypothetical protein LNV09_22750 [Paucibacter sp. B2R-40]|uniref:hypothetical protein n=1 Tax=Paucibacter sp. B2R-40 TaxID=2893554 RepID=UPI0021E39591|nr:hypothetical protein [Paucibacter sp. B2R-40]MCV2356972.1 hypothetical protein [Paucibacter sp. B2R-40]
MFTRELVELKQRQLALRLRNIELRSEMRAEAQAMLKPVSWFGAAGGLAGAVVMATGLRRAGFVSKVLGFASLGLRLARLLTALRAKP